MKAVPNSVLRGLRLLLRYRVPESELEPTFRRIMDAVSANAGDAELSLEQLAKRVRETMNELAPRPRRPVTKRLVEASPEALGALEGCSGLEREIVKRRYEEVQSIEEIAASLQVGEGRVRDVLNGLRRTIMPI